MDYFLQCIQNHIFVLTEPLDADSIPPLVDRGHRNNSLSGHSNQGTITTTTIITTIRGRRSRPTPRWPTPTSSSPTSRSASVYRTRRRRTNRSPRAAEKLWPKGIKRRPHRQMLRSAKRRITASNLRTMVAAVRQPSLPAFVALAVAATAAAMRQPPAAFCQSFGSDFRCSRPSRDFTPQRGILCQ